MIAVFRVRSISSSEPGRDEGIREESLRGLRGSEEARGGLREL